MGLSLVLCHKVTTGNVVVVLFRMAALVHLEWGPYIHVCMFRILKTLFMLHRYE